MMAVDKRSGDHLSPKRRMSAPNFMAIRPIVVDRFTFKPQMSTSWWPIEEKSEDH